MEGGEQGEKEGRSRVVIWLPRWEPLLQLAPLTSLRFLPVAEARSPASSRTPQAPAVVRSRGLRLIRGSPPGLIFSASLSVALGTAAAQRPPGPEYGVLGT
ncbi:hypothetical protein NDU88_005492 [Pleurodeles waltl]|uniref:Uncharacterized protein n=1 Tax=Pleurodeles waltl TaxID=8319 RepID=A0AAV7TC65_PLEWA|nr:hypothetical protein NDU88_005492 [Pleurodeles waltl]